MNSPENEQLFTFTKTKIRISIASTVMMTIALAAISISLGLTSALMGLMLANVSYSLNNNAVGSANLNTNTNVNQSLSETESSFDSISQIDIKTTQVGFQKNPLISASEFTDSSGNINLYELKDLPDAPSNLANLVEWTSFLINAWQNGANAEAEYEDWLSKEMEKKYDHCNEIDQWFLSLDTDAGDTPQEAIDDAYGAAFDNAESTCEDAICESHDNNCTDGSWINPEACEPYPPNSVRATCQKFGVVVTKKDLKIAEKWFAVAAVKCKCKCQCQ
jgi:hypothetical protein